MNNSDKVYIDMITDTIKKIKERISNLENKNQGIRALTGRIDLELEALNLQCNKLEAQLQELESRIELSEIKESILDRLDESADKNIEKQEDIEQDIRQLEELAGKLKTKSAKRKISKKIEHKQRIIKRLQKKGARIDRYQRMVLLPKTRKYQKQEQILSKQEAKVNLTTAKINDNNELKAMLDPENSFIDSIKSTIYDIKGVFYKKRLNYAKEVLDSMQNTKSTIALRGANVVTLSKKAANKFRKMKEAAKAKEKENNEPEITALVPVVR